MPGSGRQIGFFIHLPALCIDLSGNPILHEVKRSSGEPIVSTSYLDLDYTK